MSSYILGNTTKNAIVLVIAIVSYPLIVSAMGGLMANQVSDFLLIISMLLVTVCFANFAFTYEKSNLRFKFGKILAHSATGLFMLLTALMLESIVVSVGMIYPSLFVLIVFFSILLYLAMVLFDYWDILKVED